MRCLYVISLAATKYHKMKLSEHQRCYRDCILREQNGIIKDDKTCGENYSYRAKHPNIFSHKAD